MHDEDTSGIYSDIKKAIFGEKEVSMPSAFIDRLFEVSGTDNVDGLVKYISDGISYAVMARSVMEELSRIYTLDCDNPKDISQFISPLLTILCSTSDSIKSLESSIGVNPLQSFDGGYSGIRDTGVIEVKSLPTDVKSFSPTGKDSGKDGLSVFREKTSGRTTAEMAAALAATIERESGTQDEEETVAMASEIDEVDIGVAQREDAHLVNYVEEEVEVVDESTPEDEVVTYADYAEDAEALPTRDIVPELLAYDIQNFPLQLNASDLYSRAIMRVNLWNEAGLLAGGLLNSYDFMNGLVSKANEVIDRVNGYAHMFIANILSIIKEIGPRSCFNSGYTDTRTYSMYNRQIALAHGSIDLDATASRRITYDQAVTNFRSLTGLPQDVAEALTPKYAFAHDLHSLVVQDISNNDGGIWCALGRISRRIIEMEGSIGTTVSDIFSVNLPDIVAMVPYLRFLLFDNRTDVNLAGMSGGPNLYADAPKFFGADGIIGYRTPTHSPGRFNILQFIRILGDSYWHNHHITSNMSDMVARYRDQILGRWSTLASGDGSILSKVYAKARWAMDMAHNLKSNVEGRMETTKAMFHDLKLLFAFTKRAAATSKTVVHTAAEGLLSNIKTRLNRIDDVLDQRVVSLGNLKEVASEINGVLREIRIFAGQISGAVTGMFNTLEGVFDNASFVIDEGTKRAFGMPHPDKEDICFFLGDPFDYTGANVIPTEIDGVSTGGLRCPRLDVFAGVDVNFGASKVDVVYNDPVMALRSLGYTGTDYDIQHDVLRRIYKAPSSYPMPPSSVFDDFEDMAHFRAFIKGGLMDVYSDISDEDFAVFQDMRGRLSVINNSDRMRGYLGVD